MHIKDLLNSSSLLEKYFGKKVMFPEVGELKLAVGLAFDLTARRSETNYKRPGD
ncbi:MAG: hypothetical protein RBR63_05450 [Methanosarcina vacuolata]|jgi:hypothetical protein|nr:hypothetical protein [Methanosarcina vacuolata]